MLLSTAKIWDDNQYHITACRQQNTECSCCSVNFFSLVHLATAAEIDGRLNAVPLEHTAVECWRQHHCSLPQCCSQACLTPMPTHFSILKHAIATYLRADIEKGQGMVYVDQVAKTFRKLTCNTGSNYGEGLNQLRCLVGAGSVLPHST